MQIELIGCTSAGKTTLARKIVRAGRELGIDALLSDDFVLKLIWLNWIKNEFLRRRVIELMSFLLCLVLWPKHRKFYNLAIRVSLQAPGSWFYKFNVARIALRKIGIYEIIRRFSSEPQVILVDNEGVLQACHTLFVHSVMASDEIAIDRSHKPTRPPRPGRGQGGINENRSTASEVSAFVRFAPLPDVVIYLRQPEALLIGRILRRGHNRLPDRSYAHVERFVRQAQDAFEALQQQQALAKRMLVIDGERNALVALEDENDPLLVQARRLVENTLTRNKKLHTGGAIIAFVGADATGKSTLVAETGRWLGKIFAVKTVHVGKPPASWLTAPVHIVLPLLRRLLPQFRPALRDQIETRSLRTDAPQHPAGKSFSLIYAIRAVALAWDRCRLLFKARHWAANGEIVICDRYPSETIGAMDSPRLKERSDKVGMKANLYNWLARLEHRLYKHMPPPDMVLKLNVSLETAKQRNRERTKVNHDADDYLEIRHRESREWHRPGTKYFYDIDTERSLAETVLSVKKAIWETL